MNLMWTIELGLEGARNLGRHKLRSVLTIMGVIFGVGAVITMLGIGEGAQRTVLREIGGLGLRNIIVDSVQPPVSARKSSSSSGRGRRNVFNYGITGRDVERIRTAIPDATIAVGHLVKSKVYFRSKRLDSFVLGVPPDYFDLFDTELVDGTLFYDINNDDAHRIAVVTEEVADALQAPGGAVGRNIRIGSGSFRIIGVVRLPFRRASGSILLPYKSARDLFGTYNIQLETGSQEFSRNEIGQLVVRVADENAISRTGALIDRLLRENHTSTDYAMTVPMDLLRAKQRTQHIMNLVLIVIAAISLVVGGIGIMNVMLAIVIERVPEIGIRRAVGATRRDVMLQFLAEAVVLSTAGGVAGCLLGFVAVPLASKWTGWQGVITPVAVVASLAVSWVVGVVFGIAPAVQASRMNPVDCLRQE